MTFYDQCKAELETWTREALDELGLKAAWDVVPWIIHIIETGYRREGAGCSRMHWLKAACGYSKRDHGSGKADRP